MIKRPAKDWTEDCHLKERDQHLLKNVINICLLFFREIARKIADGYRNFLTARLTNYFLVYDVVSLNSI